MKPVIEIHRYRKYYDAMAPIFATPKAQAYTMIVLSLFCMSFFGAFAIRPTLKTIGVLKRKIEDHQFVNQKLEQKINALVLAQEEHKRTEPYMKNIYEFMPEKPEFPRLVTKLELLAQNHGATIKNVQFEPIILYGQQPIEEAPAPVDTEAPGENVLAAVSVTSVNFQITYQSSYENLVALLDQFTRLDRLLTVEGVDFSFGGDVATLTVLAEANAYYFPLNL